MNKTTNSLIAKAVAQEAELRLTIEAINTIDKYALGRGPSGRLLGVMAYGHLSGIRKALNEGLALAGQDGATADQPEFDFGLPATPATAPADNGNKTVALGENQAALVQNGQVYKTDLPTLAENIGGYLKEKVEKHTTSAALDPYGFLEKYVGRFFRHLSRRFGKKA